VVMGKVPPPPPVPVVVLGRSVEHAGVGSGDDGAGGSCQTAAAREREEGRMDGKCSDKCIIVAMV
jgi:hypothetical protein